MARTMKIASCRTIAFWPFERDTGKIIGKDIYPITTDVTGAGEVMLNEYNYGEDK